MSADETDTTSLADKIAGLDLTAGEREVLGSALAGADDEVSGFSGFGLDLLGTLEAKGVVSGPIPRPTGRSLHRPNMKRGKGDLDPDFKLR